MKTQRTPKAKPVFSCQDGFLILVMIVAFFLAITFYSTELVSIVQQIEAPDPSQDELFTVVSSIK